MEKVLIVTGASRGIGAATARLAARQGYRVCVNYVRDREAAEAVADEIEGAGGRAIAVGADVAVEEDVGRMFDVCEKTLGSLSGLVNNAGVLEAQMRVDEMDMARLRRIFATNVLGAFACARAAVLRMSTRHGGQGGAIVKSSETGGSMS